MIFFRNHRWNFVFLHIAKNAGSSIHGHYRHGESSLFPADQWDSQACIGAHPPPTWPMHRSFAIVRHPVTRFRSAIRYLNADRGLELTSKEAIEIARDESVDPRERKGRAYLRYHLMTQQHPANCLDMVERIVRFSHLEDDLRELFRDWRIPCGEIPHLNATVTGR